MGHKIFFLTALLSGLLTACNFNNDKRKSFEDVVVYNDFIVDHINALDSAYIIALDTDLGIEVCMKKCDSLVELCDRTTEDFLGIQPFKGDSSLTMQALKYTQFMKNNGNKEIKALLKLIDEYQNADYETQEAMADEIERSANRIDARYDEEINKVDKVQTQLSKKFEFRVLK